jgi:hypothetical protein
MTPRLRIYSRVSSQTRCHSLKKPCHKDVTYDTHLRLLRGFEAQIAVFSDLARPAHIWSDGALGCASSRRVARSRGYRCGDALCRSRFRGRSSRFHRHGAGIDSTSARAAEPYGHKNVFVYGRRMSARDAVLTKARAEVASLSSKVTSASACSWVSAMYSAW